MRDMKRTTGHVFTKSSFAVICLVALMVSGCGGSKAVKTDGQYAAGLAADGVSSDWNSLSARYIQDEEAVVGVANDDQYLYVMLRFRDPVYASAIQMAGLTLWLDPTGGRDKRYMLKYRGGPQPDEGSLPEHVRAERRRYLTAAAMGDSLAAERLSIMIRDEIEEMPISVGGDEGPLVASGMDQGFYVYEFRLPLGVPRVRYYAVDVAAGAQVGVGLQWGNQSRPDVLSEISRNRVLGEDMMQPPDNARPGGRPDEMGEPMARMKEHEIRLTATIAAKE